VAVNGLRRSHQKRPNSLGKAQAEVSFLRVYGEVPAISELYFVPEESDDLGTNAGSILVPSRLSTKTAK
jgi:hypothetical protein